MSEWNRRCVKTSWLVSGGVIQGATMKAAMLVNPSNPMRAAPVSIFRRYRPCRRPICSLSLFSNQRELANAASLGEGHALCALHWPANPSLLSLPAPRACDRDSPIPHISSVWRHGKPIMALCTQLHPKTLIPEGLPRVRPLPPAFCLKN